MQPNEIEHNASGRLDDASEQNWYVPITFDEDPLELTCKASSGVAVKTVEDVTEACVRSEVMSYRLLHFTLTEFSHSKVTIFCSKSNNPPPPKRY